MGVQFKIIEKTETEEEEEAKYKSHWSGVLYGKHVG